MRRRQIYGLLNSLRDGAHLEAGEEPLYPAELPASSRAGNTAPAARDDRSPQPVADNLTYRSKAGNVVMLRATETGLEMLRGSQWVPAHVMPSKRNGH